ncbi:hypothetical protein HAT86_11930 [Roseovarius gahaiensis]|uniref:Glycosyltransferase family 17 n=1 Tax=Roseovarius gahaiensis TaxID=2716691 RepID=A0A967BBY3_9RHOB|nr:hypothetical protein [Roseovarius gahaiensis]NHQ75165.1 hypothetical protein [Roseovarius gahaiensis]
MAKIIDCTLFHNEFMMLDLRFGILKNKVDKFVITEANSTFSGHSKEFKLKAWIEEHHSDIANRVDVIEVDDMPSNPNPWIKEAYQRNAVSRGLDQSHESDIVMFLDIDEIPNVDRIEEGVSNDDINALDQSFYYYYFNLYKGRWTKPSACLFRNLPVSPQMARGMPLRPIIKEAGWHFSYVMPPEAISEKISAFSHQELNKSNFNDPKKISARIQRRADLFDRKQQGDLKAVPLDASFPRFIRENSDAYADFLVTP